MGLVRRKRNWQPNAYYHIVMRGNNRQNIFSTEEDMFHLMRCIGHAYEQYRFTLVAFCIMTNHYHLLIRSEDDLSKIMRQINRRYSDYYSKRYRHVGRIYQSRYFSKEVDTPQAMLAVSRYIHRNPIETKISMVERLADYPFSSFTSYDSPDKVLYLYIDTEQLPRYLPPPFPKTIEAYVEYCLMETDELLDIKQYTT